MLHFRSSICLLISIYLFQEPQPFLRCIVDVTVHYFNTHPIGSIWHCFIWSLNTFYPSFFVSTVFIEMRCIGICSAIIQPSLPFNLHSNYVSVKLSRTRPRRFKPLVENLFTTHWFPYSNYCITRARLHKACRQKNMLSTDKYCSTETRHQPKFP